MARAKVSTHTVDTRLLAGLEHFQQQAALRALLQRLQQPELQRMVIGIVVALADQQGLAVLQPSDELSRVSTASLRRSTIRPRSAWSRPSGPCHSGSGGSTLQALSKTTVTKTMMRTTDLLNGR